MPASLLRPSLPAALLALCALAPPLRAQMPDAGPPLEGFVDTPIALEGRIDGLTPEVWWTADGNGAAEDKLMHYRNDQVRAIGPLRLGPNEVLGFPGDLVKIRGRIYGVASALRILFIVNPKNGLCVPARPPFPRHWSSVHSLAYDAKRDRLFGVDLANKQLLLIDRRTDRVTPIGAGKLVGYDEIRALAYDPDLELLYAVDQVKDILLAIDPETGAIAGKMHMRADPTIRLEDLQVFDGQLYGVNGMLTAGKLESAQLQHIDISNGIVTPIGPVRTEVSAHALLIISLPEPFHWRLKDGPGRARIEHPRELSTTVKFSEAGTYELELVVRTPRGTRVDSTTVLVRESSLGPRERR